MISWSKFDRISFSDYLMNHVWNTAVWQSTAVQSTLHCPIKYVHIQKFLLSKKRVWLILFSARCSSNGGNPSALLQMVLTAWHRENDGGTDCSALFCYFCLCCFHSSLGYARLRGQHRGLCCWIWGYGMGSGYYGGSYGYQSSYMTPYSAKSAMISMAALNFVVSLAILVVSFSKTWCVHGKTFYLTVLVVDVVLAILQCIIDIVFVIGWIPWPRVHKASCTTPSWWCARPH